MKKITAALIVLSAMIPVLAYASTDINLTSNRQAVTVGQSFTVSISLAPTETVFTSKVALSYSSDTIQFTGFTQSQGWLSLPVAGYDLVNASTGSIVKTGGLPKGLGSAGTFGTMTFRAKKVGTGTVSVASASQIYNSSNQNTFSGTPNKVTVAISAAPIAAAAVSTSTDISTSTDATSTLTAAVGNTGSSHLWLWILLLILIIILIIIWIMRRKRNKDQI